jgi:hypothetical protein
MNIYEFFACTTKLPVKLESVKDHILETGIVSKIIRVPVTLDHYILQGGYQLYRDLSPYASNEKVARIAYPREATEGVQRLVQVKEMLHVLDPHEATSPTKEKVSQLIDDLSVQSASKSVGLPATVDRNGLLHALCILAPRDAFDDLRIAYKAEKVTVDQVARWAKIPRGYAAVALTDEWADLLDRLF